MLYVKNISDLALGVTTLVLVLFYSNCIRQFCVEVFRKNSHKIRVYRKIAMLWKCMLRYRLGLGYAHSYLASGMGNGALGILMSGAARDRTMPETTNHQPPARFQKNAPGHVWLTHHLSILAQARIHIANIVDLAWILTFVRMERIKEVGSVM